VEDGVAAIVVLADLDARLDEVCAEWARRDLQLLLLLVLWEARAGEARPRFPQDRLCQLEDWRRDNAGALGGGARSCFVCSAVNRRRIRRGNLFGVPLYRLEGWRERALSGIDGSLRESEGDPLSEELSAAMKRIGELTMENEVLRMRVGHVGTLARRRSR
jgi:hypothetical protein